MIQRGHLVHSAVASLAVILTGCLEPTSPDMEPPTVQISYPPSDALLFSERDSIRVEASDNRKVTGVTIFLSGPGFESRELGTLAAPPWSFQLDTRSYPDGAYTFAVMARDAEGRAGWDQGSFHLTTLLTITSIMVLGMTDADAAGVLEIEAHLYDSEGVFLGCSGADSGLQGVDVASHPYSLTAMFQKSLHPDEPLSFDDVKGKNLFLRVIEDDVAPCPEPPDFDSCSESSPFLCGLPADDALGSTSFIVEPDFTTRTLAFDSVANLALSKRRL